jgi:hypothetical protein
VDDPEEILTRCSGRNGKAGLWLLLGMVHYNMKNYKTGSISEMTDGPERLGGSEKIGRENIRKRSVLFLNHLGACKR